MKRLMYRVDSDITLEEIAERYNTTSKRIVAINNIQGELFRGMRLIIEQGEGEYYIVQPFDTLEKIAAKFNVDVQRISESNCVDRVFIGQKVFVPKD